MTLIMKKNVFLHYDNLCDFFFFFWLVLNFLQYLGKAGEQKGYLLSWFNLAFPVRLKVEDFACSVLLNKFLLFLNHRFEVKMSY